MKRASFLMAVGYLFIASSWAADLPTREDLKRKRQAIEAEYAKRAEECRHQFVVTPCLDKLRLDKQQALSQVSVHERAHDAADRQARADARNQRVADKAATAAHTAASAAAATVASAPSRADAGSHARHPPKPHAPRSKASPKQDRQAQEQESRAAFEARQREIDTHRQAVEKRNAERARSKTPPRPLSPPASAGT